VTWGSGTSGVTGVVSAANSLIGGTAEDLVGYFGVTALNNGNYVVSSAGWDNGTATNAGAVTWGSGTSGVTGVVSAANSLIGSTAEGLVGYSGVTALNNGNYVVSSFLWGNGAVTNVGAVTWGSGTSGVTGAVSAANSLVGSTADDQVGSGIFGLFGVTGLNNGNYVVSSSIWDNGAATNAGAVTWGSGTGGATGVVSAANSLVGSTADDQVGYVTALSNGNYVVQSTLWDNGAATNAGAVTWSSGTSGVAGAVSAANSLVGSGTNDQVGGAFPLNNGDYIVSSPIWDNGAGAVTLGNGMLGTTGVVSAANSVLGNVAGAGLSMVIVYDYLTTRLLVGYPPANRVSLSGYIPEIAVEQPQNVNLGDGATRSFSAPVGANTSLTFTIRNSEVGDLTGLSTTIDGSDAALFTVTTNPTAPVSPLASTTFTVRFAPTTTGTKTAALHIANNDPDENPFDINLLGHDLSFSQDTDGDGLTDAAEFYLAALNFDWQVSQSNLVNILFTNANSANLYTTNQIQALNVNSPLLQKDPTNGLFTLTIGVQKSTNLVTFSPFPMTAPQTAINGLGQLEFQFNATDNAAFYRLEAH
jgi:Repeat of unknown function (DUF5650)/Cep192 domain 4